MGRNGDEENVHRAVETIQILQSMYSLPGESELSPDTHEFLSHWSETPQDGEVSPLAPRQLELTINLELDGSEEHILQVSAEIPLHIGHPTLTPKQPVWLSKGEFDGLINSGGEAPNSPDILDDIVHQLEELKSMTERISMSKNDYESTPNEEGAEQVERVWFWFPSLSSKEKRRDLVDYALENSLTGFIVAGKSSYVNLLLSHTVGKPGLLCVEGSGKKVDQYMADIKSRSWSDIPAYQKKVCLHRGSAWVLSSSTRGLS